MFLNFVTTKIIFLRVLIIKATQLNKQNNIIYINSVLQYKIDK